MFAEIEALGIPVIAAIHGLCLGGGLELALACHGRVVTDHGKTVLGLPEVQLGLLPGSGGTQRLPRLIRVAKALDLMLTGKQVRAKQARKLGLVDDMVPPSILLEAAIQACQEGQARHHLESGICRARSLGDQQIWSQGAVRSGPQGVRPRPGQLPGAGRIIEVVRIGVEEGMRPACWPRPATSGELVMTPESAALRSSSATTEMKKEVSYQGPSRARWVMPPCWGRPDGGGIAFVTATQGGVPVRIEGCGERRHRQMPCVTATTLLARKLKRRQLLRSELEKQMSLLTGTWTIPASTGWTWWWKRCSRTSTSSTRWCRTWSRVQLSTPCLPQHLSLPIHQIASAATHPEQVVGLHYFSPVDKMPLAEIIPHAGTSAETVATTWRSPGPRADPIVVKDEAGFYVNRILAPT